MIKWLREQLKKLKRRSRNNAAVGPLNTKIPEIPPHEITYDKEIGNGAFANVYNGIWKNETVAIKKIFQLSPEDNEINIMFRLNHPHIVKLHGVSHSIIDIYPALVMEYMAKGSLEALMMDENNCSYVISERIRVAQEVAAGMTYMHKNNVIHRDIKIENILLSGTGRAAITDFGLAIQYTGVGYKSRKAAGSLRYIAPEVISPDAYGDIIYTPKVDVFAFGKLLYVLWHFRRPYEDVEDEFEFRFNIRNAIHDPISIETPTYVKNLMINLMSYDPTLRYAAADIIPRLNLPSSPVVTPDKSRKLKAER